MTGFAARRGEGAGHSWTWDIRSVNGKGLDIRLRLPDWVEGLEPLVRAAVAKSADRGNVSLNLRVVRDGGDDTVRVNPAGLAAALAALATAQSAAERDGLVLSPTSGADLLVIRGVLESGGAETETATLRTELMTDLPALLTEFDDSRRAEGAALAAIISAQIDRIEVLVAEAQAGAEARRPQMAEALRDSLARITAEVDRLDPDRLAQELALLAVKADVTEEIDRLTAHVAAARALLTQTGSVGRKFDFLMQEFMREANTLCSKSGNADLTRIGLDLKTVIDQMREQVQNVE